MKQKSRYDSIALRPAKAVDSFDEYQGVWVIVEQREGQIQDVTRELLGAARPMAAKLNTTVTAVLLCEADAGMSNELIAAGADKVIVCEHPILRTPLARPSTDVLARVIKDRKPDVVLIGATHTGRDVSSRVAVKIDAGMTADCTELDVDPLNSELLARRPAFGGKMLAAIRCDRHRPQMATARPGIFIPLDKDESRTGEVETIDVSYLGDVEYAAKVVEFVIDDNKIDITKEDVLVGVGLGIGGPDALPQIEALAEALGGKVACTRPVADKGWLPRGQQIGQTGLSVRPKLYISIGISGAIQHIEGMKEAGTVIAINSDPNAQMFQYADIGLVGDWKGHVAALTKAAQDKKLDAMKWLVPVTDSLGADREAAAERAAKAGKTAPAPKKAPAPSSGTTVAAAAPAPSAAPTAAETAPAPEQEPAAPEPAAEPEPEPEAASDTYEGDPMDQEAVKAWVKDNVTEDKKAWVLAADCIVCNGCDAACPTGAAVTTDIARVDRDLCIADGACFDACPTDAIRPGVEDEEQTAGWPEGSRRAGEIGIPE